MKMVLSGLAAGFWLVLMPFFLGNLILGVCRREKDGLFSCLIAGYLLFFSVTELVFVPLIFARAPFHTAVYLEAAVLLVFMVLSVLLYHKNMAAMVRAGGSALFHQPAFVYAAAALVLLQAGMYVVFMVTDLDDAFFVATATTAQQSDTMYLTEAYRGLPLKNLTYRYVLSPMSMLYAFLSEMTDIHAATVAHTVLPFFLVSLAYMVYDRLGMLLFKGKRETVGLFLCLLSLIHISSYYSVYTQGTFLLIRIWQGKATLAAILLPFLFYICFKVFTQYRERGDWLLAALTVMSACMVSSMGIALAPILMGIFALLFGLPQKKWKELGMLLLCMTPCIILGLMYLEKKVL